MNLYRRVAALATAAPQAPAAAGPDGAVLTRAELMDRIARPRPRHPGAGAEDPLAVVIDQLRAQREGGQMLTLATSGSSTAPRMVRRSVRSWTASLDDLDALVRPRPIGSPRRRDDGWLWAPGTAGSTLTLYGVWHGLGCGIPVLASGSWHGVPREGPLAEHAARASVIHCAPAVLQDVLESIPERVPGSAGSARRGGSPGRRVLSLRTAVVAGGRTSARLRERARGAEVRLVEYYGAAELSFVAVDPDGGGLRPFPGVEVEVRDGVVWARSELLAEGVAGLDGWAAVGDRARLRDDGTLELLGRPGVAEVAGHTVHLAEVEALLAGVTGVAEIVCLAEPRPRVGERVLAVFRPEDGADPLAGLRAAARRLPPASRPGRFVRRVQLPRTPAGKVARDQLADELRTAGATLAGGRGA